MDLSAVLFNLVTSILTLIATFYAVKIGKRTGFIGAWKNITYGLILTFVSRLIMVEAETDHILEYSPTITLKEVSLTITLIGTFLILIGMKQFANVLVKKNGS